MAGTASTPWPADCPRRFNRRSPLPWPCPTTPCARCSKPALTSATSPTAGTRRWQTYIFGTRNNIHIIDLAQTVPAHPPAPCRPISDTVAKRRPCAVRRHQASGRRHDRGSRQAFGAVLRQFPLARRHADQLEDHFGLDRSVCARSTRPSKAAVVGLTKKERLMLSREKRQTREGSRRHQGHGRRARPAVRDRHQQGAARNQGGPAPRDPGGGHRRHQLQPGRHHLSDPGQRRRQPRHPALLRPRGPCRHRRHLAQPGRARHRPRRDRAAGRGGSPRGRPDRPGRVPRPRPSSSSCCPPPAARRTTCPS